MVHEVTSIISAAAGLACHTSVDLAYKGQDAQMNLYHLLLMAQQVV